MAGGLTDFGSLKKIMLIRKTEKGSRISYLNLTDNAILNSDELYLRPNDIIYIPSRSGKSFILSEFPYDSIITILSILLAGFLGYYNIKLRRENN